MNQPPTTETTPVTRYTALSRPQARSAREEPIATMKVTYVVERGSFKEVPTAIKRPPSTRFTDARTRSNATSSRSSSGVKRLLTQFLTPRGVLRDTAVTAFVVTRTRLRANPDVPNISLPSFCCFERPMDVCNTLLAFLLVHNATTIIRPATNRKNVDVFAGSASEVIMSSSAPAPDETYTRKESKPANVTPIKFTRSFPAKASAKENVPTSTTTLSTFTLHQWSSCISTVNSTKQPASIISVFSSTNTFAESETIDVPFKPLISMKYTIDVTATPPNMPILEPRFFL